MTADFTTQHKAFLELAALYRETWRKADAEKRKTGRISAKTRKQLESIAERLNV